MFIFAEEEVFIHTLWFDQPWLFWDPTDALIHGLHERRNTVALLHSNWLYRYKLFGEWVSRKTVAQPHAAVALVMLGMQNFFEWVTWHFQCLDFIASSISDELERVCKEAVIAQSRYYHSICLDGLKKMLENFTYAIYCLRFERDISRIHV